MLDGSTRGSWWNKARLQLHVSPALVLPYLTVDLGGTPGVSCALDTAGTFSFIVVHVLSEVLESSCIF